MTQKFTYITKLIVLFLGIAYFSACDSFQDKRFSSLSAEETGIDFRNDLEQTPELNILNYLYFFDGGGVSAGDLNGDGLPDLFFTSNQNQNKLYINKSDMKFEDVTETAIGTVENDWTTGVSFVDINDDGRLDIYVSNVGSYLQITGENKLYVNQGNNEDGIPTFEEQAKEYGLDLVGFSTQAAFFDYDRDGDLDMYMMNHSVHSLGTFNDSSIREDYHPLAGDRLMRNDGGKFTDVTEEAGIYNSALGYGLGIAISDINRDGYPDIYIGNDFHEDDYLYINNGDGTFTESLEEMIRHTSRSSMGNELVDINNDGLVDIFSLDMLPDDYEMLKASAAEDPLPIYKSKLGYGYKHQFSRNTLQLNRGDNHFSEIGLLADVYATGWSWATLGADFDNNGYIDLFVTNGIKGRTNDLDYIKFISNDNIQYRLSGDLTEEEVALTDRMPEEKIHNYMYKNSGSLLFDDVSEEWGFGEPTFSNGATYADLDGDGDLDIVTNDVNSEAAVYKNNTRENNPESNYLKIKFNGKEGNKFGVGTRVEIQKDDGETMLRELYPVRGYQSSVGFTLHFGLDSLDTVPKMKVTWPDGMQQVLNDIPANQTLTLSYRDATDDMKAERDNSEKSLFTEVTDDISLNYKHEENDFIEFTREPLIPHMVSQEGPAIAVADVNGDGLDDIYAGGAKRQPSKLFLQNEAGTFEEKPVASFQNDYIYEDVDAVFEDFDGDGDQDLLVVSGGNEYYGNSEYMLPRLYWNNGNGNFVRDRESLPDLFITGSTVAVADVDNDGDKDLFIGARAVPWNYGEPPTSYLLINDNGTFKKDTSEFGKRFSDLGMVTDAQWADIDGDGYEDLVVASEWSSIKVIYSKGEEKVLDIPNSTGLWNTVHLTDIDKDGRTDIVAGNLGLNSKYKASPEAPLRMYFNDFDENGKKEQLVTVMKDGKERIFATRDELAEQLDYITKEFETYQSFGEASLYEVIDRRLLDDAVTYEVHDLRSSVFYNTPEGFMKEALPMNSQFSPIHGIIEYNETGSEEAYLISAGNYYDANIQRGRYDAGYGTVFANKADGKLSLLPNDKINWFLDGEIRTFRTITVDGNKLLIAGKNDRPLSFYRYIGN